jgi:hypothetical protein
MLNDKFLALKSLNAMATLFTAAILLLLAGWTANTNRNFDFINPMDLFVVTVLATISGLFSIGNVIPPIMRRLGYSKLVYVSQRILACSWFGAFILMTALENNGGILDSSKDLRMDQARITRASQLGNAVRAFTVIIGLIYVGLSHIVYKISVGRGLSNFTKLEKIIRKSQHFLRNSQYLFRNSQSAFRNSRYPADTISQSSEVLIRVPDLAYTRETREKSIYAIALYDYNGSDEADLGFKEGQILRVTKYSQNHNEWWEGEVNGRQGEFPGTFVKLFI